MEKPHGWVWLWGADAALEALCARALEGVAPVTGVTRTPWTVPPDQVDAALVLAVLPAPLREGATWLAQCRERLPLLPVVLLTQGLSASVAVELIKCGAADLCELPAQPGVLRRKVERALGRWNGPALEDPGLRPLLPVLPSEDEDRRQQERVPVPARRQAQVVVRLPHGPTVLFRVDNLTLETGHLPGGMTLETDAQGARLLPLAQWKRGMSIPLVVRLTDGEETVVAVGRLIGDARPGPGGAVRLGVEYWPQSPKDRMRLQRFWAECQGALPLRQVV